MNVNTSKRAFLIMLSTTVLLATLAGVVVYGGMNALQRKGNDLAQLKEKQEVLKKRETALIGAKRDIQDYADLEKISKAIVPQEKDQARTVREIVTIASTSGIQLESIQFPASTLGTLKKTKGSSSSSTSSQKGVAATDPNKTQLTAVPGISGLYAMEIQIQSNKKAPIPYSRLLGFLEKLEQNRRTAHVTNISIEPSKENRNLVTFTVTLNVYIKP